MQWGLAWAALGLALGACVEPPPVYPLAITDRPILLPEGVTELDFDLQLRTYVETTTDATGHTTTQRTGLTDNSTPDLSVSHGFGNIELDADLGQLASASVSVATQAIPAVVTVGANATAPQTNHTSDYDEFVRASHKVVLVPAQLAVFGYAVVGVNEVTALVAPGTLASGIAIVGAVGAQAELQLTRRLGLTLGLDSSTVLRQAVGGDRPSALGAFTNLLLAFRRWDLYAAFSLGDVTRSPSTEMLAGFAHRWGL